jgi:hypothetical protein
MRGESTLNIEYSPDGKKKKKKMKKKKFAESFIRFVKK